jgi:hypothetical protein
MHAGRHLLAWVRSGAAHGMAVGHALRMHTGVVGVARGHHLAVLLCAGRGLAAVDSARGREAREGATWTDGDRHASEHNGRCFRVKRAVGMRAIGRDACGHGQARSRQERESATSRSRPARRTK